MARRQTDGMVRDQAPDELVAALIREGEESGCVELSQIDELARELELEDDEVQSLLDQLESRGVDVSDDCGREAAPEPTRYKNGDEVAYVATVYNGVVVSGKSRPDGDEVTAAAFFTLEELQSLPLSNFATLLFRHLNLI